MNISSVLGQVTIPLMGAYTASKHAVESLSDALRMELKPIGIDVITIAPGSIRTNFGSTLTQTLNWLRPDSPYRAAYEQMRSDRLSDRGAEPTVIAQAILRAVRSPRPKARYAIPWDAKLMPVAKAALPKRAIDNILRRVIMGQRS
ncbi:dehydrogenase [Alicyclobacillus contaminans]|nr:dehydrogenase [Alicyclobacillus contaminans]